MNTDERQLLDDIRAQHPHFLELERATRRRWPHLDEMSAAIVVSSLIECLDDADAAALESSNPGLDRVQ